MLVLDMDGTAYEQMGSIVEKNIKPLIAVQEMGIKLAFVTGRPIFAPHNNFEKFGLSKHELIMAAYNGAAIYDVNNKKLLDTKVIPKELIKKAFEILNEKEFKDSEIWVYSNDFDIVFVNKPVEGSKGLFWEVNFFDKKIIVVDSKTKYIDCFKILLFEVNEKLVERLEEIGLEVAWHKGGIAAEINLKDINKKYAINFLCNYWNIKPENVMAMGDGSNDISMMKSVGFPIAPKNAIDEIKKISIDTMNETNMEGAVKCAIEKYILKGE